MTIFTQDYAESTTRQTGATGLEALEMGAGRIHVDDKQIINCRADLNQLVPFKYNWAWDKYLTGCANHWMPNEISMSADLAIWNDPEGYLKMSGSSSNAISDFSQRRTLWSQIIWC